MAQVEQCVIDARGRVREMKDLFLSSSSIMLIRRPRWRNTGGVLRPQSPHLWKDDLWVLVNYSCFMNFFNYDVVKGDFSLLWVWIFGMTAVSAVLIHTFSYLILKQVKKKKEKEKRALRANSETRSVMMSECFSHCHVCDWRLCFGAQQKESAVTTPRIVC